MGVTTLRGFVIAALVLTLALYAGAVMAQDTTSPEVMTTPGTDVSAASMDQNLENFQTSLVSSCLNVPQSSVTTWRNRGFTFGQIAMAANIANRANVSLDTVMTRLVNGEGWNTIASAYNLSMADATSVMVTPRDEVVAVAPEVRGFTNAFLVSYYGISQSDLDSFHSRGFNNEEIAFAANIAARSNRSVSSILDMRAQGMSWSQIASNVNVPLNLAQTPVEPMVTSQEIALMRSLIAREFLLTGSQIDQLRARGYTWSQIAMIGNISARSGRSPFDVADMLDQGMTWNQIAGNVGISTAALNNPFQPAGVVRPGGPAAGRGVLPRTGK